jgi:hypothetical protein
MALNTIFKDKKQRKDLLKNKFSLSKKNKFL